MTRLPWYLYGLTMILIYLVYHFWPMQGGIAQESLALIAWDFLDRTEAYLWLMIASMFFPFVLSFDRKVAYWKSWKHLWAPLLLVSLPYIIWDVGFTHIGVWGFNPDYLIGWDIFNLPIEEISFFVVIPFSCVFIYECVISYRLDKLIGASSINIMALFWVLAGMMLPYYWGNLYTGTAAISVLTSVPVLLLYHKRDERRQIATAMVLSYIPFFIVNSVLTGSITERPIVQYNMVENMGFRVGTIPADDFIYQTGMLLSMYLVYHHFKYRKK